MLALGPILVRFIVIGLAERNSFVGFGVANRPLAILRFEIRGIALAIEFLDAIEFFVVFNVLIRASIRLPGESYRHDKNESRRKSNALIHASTMMSDKTSAGRTLWE
ncbi:MAG: hypothetical protein ACOYM8_11115 [Caulobacterales bacterium]